MAKKPKRKLLTSKEPLSPLLKDGNRFVLAERIFQGDFLEVAKGMADGGLDLAFMDPPFNIGYEYDEYHDKKKQADYEGMVGAWMRRLYELLDPQGTFWLAIGDEQVSELDIIAKKIGFHRRSWVVWHYTFGVNFEQKLTRSHAHLLYYTKHRDKFTFNPQRVPSARQLVYNSLLTEGDLAELLCVRLCVIRRLAQAGSLPHITLPGGSIRFAVDDVRKWIREHRSLGEGGSGNDKRAKSKGRNPDDTWILRPQWCPEGFYQTSDTWYVPRINGTFKERIGTPNQMPEQLLGRIIRMCSNEGDLLFDPCSGSGSFAVTAKKLGRKGAGTELSADYARMAQERLKATKVGDELAGSVPLGT